MRLTHLREDLSEAGMWGREGVSWRASSRGLDLREWALFPGRRGLWLPQGEGRRFHLRLASSPSRPRQAREV